MEEIEKDNNKEVQVEHVNSDDGQLIKWINTPFVYKKVLIGRTKLEQDILLQVSENIQTYVKKFLDSKRYKQQLSPNPLFTEEQKLSLAPIRVTLADYGIKPNHYDKIKTAVETILDIKWGISNVSGDTTTVTWYNVFSRGMTEFNRGDAKQTSNRGYIDFFINPDIADIAFDMSEGYVKHPRLIARNSDGKYTTLLYLLIKYHCSKSGKCTIPLLTIKDELDIKIYDSAGHFVDYGMVQYNQFKKQVLEKVKKDLERQGELGEVDYSYTYKEIRSNNKKKGDPAAIEFTLVPTSVIKNGRGSKSNLTKNRLINDIINHYGDVDKRVVSEIISRVPKEDFMVFQAYYYKDVPKIMEKAYLDTPEEIVSFLISLLNKWIDERLKSKPQQKELFPEFEEPAFDAQTVESYKKAMEIVSPEWIQAFKLLKHNGNPVIAIETQAAWQTFSNIFGTSKAEEIRQVSGLELIISKV